MEPLEIERKTEASRTWVASSGWMMPHFGTIASGKLLDAF